MRIRTTLTTLALLFLLPAEAQERHVIEGRFDVFTTDEIGNVYALRGDELELYNSKGASWLRNSVKTFGRITHIDAFYSLKPMVFSPEQGQIAVLDNTLSLQGSVMNLSRSGYPQAVLACISVQNSFWLFDQRDLALVRVDAQFRNLANTGRLDQLLGISPAPTSMQEFDSRLYVNDPNEGILVFDLFGTYAKTIPLKGVESFEVRDGVLYYFSKGQLFIYDMRSFAITEHALADDLQGKVLEVRVERGRLYQRTADSIVIDEVVTTH
ncbi:MAG: hypothetical protein JNL43_06400 [Flavobacteriales bacterium]|nr:hypothetical protein [Flavobacteriales bacterium]HRH68746.1 hypothetical protein [Flavobacteriales bacterium]